MKLSDTSADARRVHAEVMRRMSGVERFQYASKLTVYVHELTRVGIRARMPGATPEQVEAEHYRLVFGRALAERVLAYRAQIRQERSARS